MPPFGKRRKGKQARKVAGSRTETSSDASGKDPTENTDDTPSRQGEEETAPSEDNDLILTSEKRRGVYECDYCHSDISQLPRVRCAVCPDFDLCLDCFATTDHSTVMARLKAASSVLGGTEGGIGISAAALHHDDTHGYRVCDSSRYPLFPTSRKMALSTSRSTSFMDDRLQEPVEENQKEEETESATKQDAAESAKPEATSELPVSHSEKPELQGGEEVTTTPSNTKDVSVDQTESGEFDTTSREVDSTTKEGKEDKEEEGSDIFLVQSEDPRTVWTVEEDLRLLEGIKMHGLANWVEVSEVVSGQGSTGKTPKRCMERYFDDFLGRFGHILPAYMLMAEEEEEVESEKDGNDAENEGEEEQETPRASKRRAVLMRTPSSFSNVSGSRKKFKAVPTESCADYEEVWPNPYLPNIGVQPGQEVGREQAYKAEQAFVKAIASLDSKEKVEQVRKEWEETRLNKPGGPTVLPMRPEDVVVMPGAELAGFMPRRGDFDVEWEQEQEQAIADMEFLPGEPEQDKQLKLQVLTIYNSVLEEREKRKQFILSRKLYDYRKRQAEDQQLPRDERDLVQRMRLFERFHTPKEHEKFLADILKAKRLRKEIAKLQLYRRIGIRTLAEAEKYELDKKRHLFHRTTHQQKENETKNKAGAASGSNVAKKSGSTEDDSSASLWKQYRTGKFRRRMSGSPMEDSANDGNPGIAVGTDSQTLDVETENTVVVDESSPVSKADDAMEVDEPAESSMADAEEKTGRDGAAQTPVIEDDFAKYPGYSLLSEREVALCRKSGLLPGQYIEVKKVLIHESLRSGLLDKENCRRILLQIDVEKRGDVVDFLVRAGWVSVTVGEATRSLK